MAETEFAEKIAPLAFTNQHGDEYELPEMIDTLRGTETLDGKVVIEGGMDDPYRNLRMMDNPRFRSFMGKLVNSLSGYHGIFPEVTEAFTPRINLVMEYPNQRLIYWGNVMEPASVQEKPIIDFVVPAIKNRYWTLFCVGQEVGSERQYNHWTIVNIPSLSLQDGKEVAPYIPPNPPINSDLHRYVFFLCSQSAELSEWEIENFSEASQSGRETFNTDAFLAKYSLAPKGLSFFHSRWHPSVPGPHTRLRVWPPDLDPTKGKSREFVRKNKERRARQLRK